MVYSWCTQSWCTLLLIMVYSIMVYFTQLGGNHGVLHGVLPQLGGNHGVHVIKYTMEAMHSAFLVTWKDFIGALASCEKTSKLLIKYSHNITLTEIFGIHGQLIRVVSMIQKDKLLFIKLINNSRYERFIFVFIIISYKVQFIKLMNNSIYEGLINSICLIRLNTFLMFC